MSFDLAKIAIVPERLHKGVWYEVYRDATGRLEGRVIPAPSDNGCVLIIPMGAAYDRALEDAQRPHLALLRERKADPQTMREIEAQALAGVVLADWRNLTIRGEPVEFSVELARKLLADLEWLGLREFVQTAGQHRGALLALEEEQARGN